MKDLSVYIQKEVNSFDIIYEELTSSDKGNNILIDQTDDYNLYCGGHLYKRLWRDVEDTDNPGDKIPIYRIKDTIKKGFYHIENCYNSNRLKENNPDYAICITNKKYNPNLNIVIYIKKIESDPFKYNLIIKTVMNKNGFASRLKRYINEEFIDNIIFIEI